MLCSELKEMRRKAWSEKINYLCIDMIKNENDCNYCIFKENKNPFFDCIPENEAF